MNFLETLRIVVLNLLENKFKVFLTSLGILVGTVTIVMVIAIGKGGEQQVAAQFKGLSAETVYVNLNFNRIGNEDFEKIEKLNLKILHQLLDESKTMKGAYISNTGFKEIGFGKDTDYLSIAAVSHNYDIVSNLAIDAGVHLSEEDQEYEKNVVVLGNNLVKKYYGSGDKALGQTIKIGNQHYKIIGTLKNKGDGIQGLNPDDTIFFPYAVGEKILDTMSMPKIIGLSSDLKNVEMTKKEIMNTLNYVLEDSSFYVVEDAGSRIDAALSSARTMNYLLFSVGTIVFIVGGIGIMNVLFLSVKERTKEIGILKALGSKNEEILGQFVIESGIISCLGGISGIALSSFLLPLMKYTSIAVADTWQGKIIALAFAIVTGTLFGIYPAYKASQLRPVDALSIE